MDIKQINSAIMFGQFTDVELNSVLDALKFARGVLANQNKRALRLGSKVKWNSPKQGCVVEGTVLKLATKYATVSENGRMMQWKVPMNMLEVA